MRVLQTFKRFGWTQWLILCALILVLCFTGFYVYRTVERAAYWRSHHDQPIENWMPLGYIAHSYHVPPRVLYEAVALKPEPHDRRSLIEIAKIKNRPVADIKKVLDEAVTNFRQTKPPLANGGQP